MLKPLGKGTPASAGLFGLMAVPYGRKKSMPSQEDDTPFLQRLAGDIRSVAEQAPEIADELREIANDLDTEVQQRNEAELRRRDFTLSTRSLSARLATRS
jgi:hypothetical protein